MRDLDAVAPNYRRACARWPEAATLAGSYGALASCFEANPYGSIEHVKSFVECVCLTILAEFGDEPPSGTPTTTELLVVALRSLGLQNSRGASKLDKVLSGFNRLADALTDMRNDCGPVAHGKDGFLDALTADNSRAFVHTGDAIVSVLMNALEGKEPDLVATREPYQSFMHLNARIDRAVSVSARVEEDDDRATVVVAVSTAASDEAFEIRVVPSRFLYGLDRLAYVEVLKSTDLAVSVVEEPLPTPENTELVRASSISPLIESVSTYAGRLTPVRTALELKLTVEGLSPTTILADGSVLTDTLLATADKNMGLDWTRREALKAGLKISLKRVLVHFGFADRHPEAIAEELVELMRDQVPDPGEGGVLTPPMPVENSNE